LSFSNSKSAIHENYKDAPVITSNKNRIVQNEISNKKKDSSKILKIKRKGYVEVDGPEVTLSVKDIPPIDALMFLSKIGDYSFVYVPNTDEKKEDMKNKITISFKNQDYEVALNSILMAAGWEGKKENNIIFVGEEVLEKGFNYEISKVYKMNHASASSAADYLASLGAVINKVYISEAGAMVKSTVEKSFNKDSSVKSYGANQGPLKGLIGTSDSRLEAITLIGSEEIVSLAEEYLFQLDESQKQVAMTVKILDVNLEELDELNNSFGVKMNNPTAYILNSEGNLNLALGDISSWQIKEGEIGEISLNNATNFDFLNWLKLKLTSESTKVLASPTMILSESKNQITGGQEVSSQGDAFSSASIGRPYGNESFLTVGTKVITNYKVTAGENGAPPSCEAEFGTAGLTFGAKVHKVDKNDFVSFSLSPELSSISKTMEIGTCGSVNILSVRRVDTGSIRVKSGNTLVLTGVLSDTFTESNAKVPILGDIPLISPLFRKKSNGIKKNELIILVTPNVINNGIYNQENYEENTYKNLVEK